MFSVNFNLTYSRFIQYVALLAGHCTRLQLSLGCRSTIWLLMGCRSTTWLSWVAGWQFLGRQANCKKNLVWWLATSYLKLTFFKFESLSRSNRQTKSYNGNKADKSNGYSTWRFTVRLTVFCAFGICTCKSFAWTCWWNWPQVSVSSTFYTQFLCSLIPKAQKDTDDVTLFLHFWDLRA